MLKLKSFRVTHHSLLLKSNYKLRFSRRSIYCNETFIFMSTQPGEPGERRDVSPCTELPKMGCTWLREMCSCSCKPVLPDPAWVQLSKIYNPFLGALYINPELSNKVISSQFTLPLRPRTRPTPERSPRRQSTTKTRAAAARPRYPKINVGNRFVSAQTQIT